MRGLNEHSTQRMLQELVKAAWIRGRGYPVDAALREAAKGREEIGTFFGALPNGTVYKGNDRTAVLNVVLLGQDGPTRMGIKGAAGRLNRRDHAPGGGAGYGFIRHGVRDSLLRAYASRATDLELAQGCQKSYELLIFRPGAAAGCISSAARRPSTKTSLPNAFSRAPARTRTAPVSVRPSNAITQIDVTNALGERTQTCQSFAQRISSFHSESASSRAVTPVLIALHSSGFPQHADLRNICRSS